MQVSELVESAIAVSPGEMKSATEGRNSSPTHLASILFTTSSFTLLLRDLWRRECVDPPISVAEIISPATGWF